MSSSSHPACLINTTDAFQVRLQDIAQRCTPSTQCLKCRLLLRACECCCLQWYSMSSNPGDCTSVAKTLLHGASAKVKMKLTA